MNASLRWELCNENELGFRSEQLKDAQANTHASLTRRTLPGYGKEAGVSVIKIDAEVANGKISLSSLVDDMDRMRKIVEYLVALE